MKKIPTLFTRDWEGDRSRVLDQVEPGCEWVLDGEGVPTRKYDGACVMLDWEGKWWARREVKDGKETPPGFISAGHDHITLKNVGWEPIKGSSFFKWFTEALQEGTSFETGTYELIGEKVNGNPEKVEGHELVRHEDAAVLTLPGRTFEDIRSYLMVWDIEGIVFHHPDGRMAKIKTRDLGFKRGTP